MPLMNPLTLPELDRLIPKLARDEKELDKIRMEVSERKTLHSILVGHIDDYEAFLDKLDDVWRGCFDKLVVAGWKT